MARLVAHEFKGSKVQNVGYLGNEKGDSLRSPKDIYPTFKRTENGTDIYVLGYETGATWQSEIKFSVLEKFWVAVMRKKLVVEVDGEKIDVKSLPRLMQEFSLKNDFKAHHYYKAAVSDESTKFEETLKHLGKVSLSLIDGLPELPKKIAMVRSTGMVIYEKSFRSIVPYAGFFFCNDAEGNKKLSSMEPPKHDEWDKDHPEPGSNRKTLVELNDWLREKIKAFKPIDNSTTITIPDLYKLLPDDSDTEFSNSAVNTGDKTENPDLTPKAEIPFVQVKVKEEKPKGKKGEHHDPTRISFESRIFLAEAETNTYRVVLKPAKTATETVRIAAVGDDAQPFPVRILKAWGNDSHKIEIDEKGAIQNLSLNAEQDKYIYIQIDSSDKLSLEAAASYDND